jgi:hypothetical protein
MYTIKLSDTHPDFATIFDLALSGVLARHNIKYDGVHPFLGRGDMFSMAGFTKNSSHDLTFQDWTTVNRLINYILDELDVSARVQNERYAIREGRKELTDYKRRKRWQRSVPSSS